MKNYNIWKIEGYKGFNDFDGRDNYNFCKTMIFDKEFSKKDIEEIIIAKYSKNNRVVVAEATLSEESSNNWDYNEMLKEKYLPLINKFIAKLEMSDEDLELDFIGTGLAPYHLWKILEELGYKNIDLDSNGWEQDFWIKFTKKGYKTILITACGMTQEVKISNDAE